jgi:hypothetical protein
MLLLTSKNELLSRVEASGYGDKIFLPTITSGGRADSLAKINTK